MQYFYLRQKNKIYQLATRFSEPTRAIQYRTEFFKKMFDKQKSCNNITSEQYDTPSVYISFNNRVRFHLLRRFNQPMSAVFFTIDTGGTCTMDNLLVVVVRCNSVQQSLY